MFQTMQANTIQTVSEALSAPHRATMARVAASRVAVILAEAASVEEAAAQGRLFPHAAPKAFRATYHLVILRLFYSDAFYSYTLVRKSVHESGRGDFHG